MALTFMRLIWRHCAHNFAAICIVFLASSLLACCADGQDETAKPPTAVTVAPAGAQRFSTGQWAALAVVGVNPTDKDSEEVVSVFMGDESQLQFSTKFWLPSHSKRQTWMPVRVPSGDSVSSGRVEMSMLRLVESDGVESFANNFVGMPISKRSMMLADSEINTGLLIDLPGLEDAREAIERSNTLSRVINAGRDTTVESLLDLPSVNFVSNFLPPTKGALDELDQIVIAGNHLVNDTRGITAVRHWLRKGGRLWIMLDVTDQALVTELLGQDVSHTEIDRVELNQLQFVMTTPAMGRSDTDGGSWSSEVPAQMVRVLTDIPEKDVACKVDGWPAAFWKRVGDGEVLFTTLDARAWIDGDGQAEGQAEGKASAALYHLSRTFFEPKHQSTDFQQALSPILDRKIGYRIPSRRLATTLLGINALVILVAGIWWMRQRRLERMAILVPVSAIVTTIAMLAIGTQHAQSVPSTVATGQVIRINQGTGEADISTVMAVYSQDAGDLGLVSGSGTLTMPVENEGGTSIRRVRLGDDGSSRWIGADQPPGVVRHFVSDSTLQLTSPIRVRGTFNANGFLGSVAGLESRTFDDGVIVRFPAPLTGVTLDTDSSGEQSESAREISAGIMDRLASDQFVPGTLLSDDQRIRQEFLRDLFDGPGLFDGPEDRSMGNQLSLLFWTDPIDIGVQFSDRFDHRGSALVSVPVQIDRPVPGSDFVVPATFIHTEPLATKLGISSLIDPRTGRWLESLTKPVVTELIFAFPKALAAMNLQSVNVSMKINAPSRSLVIRAMIDGKPEIMHQQKDPTGVVEFTIDRKEALGMHAEGGLWISFEITESDNAIKQRAEKMAERAKESLPQIDPIRIDDSTTWQIDYIHLDAVGRIESDNLTSTAATSTAGRP